MPELMTGSHHSIDMVIRDSIDTVACSFLNVQARGPPGSLNKSARGVSHVALPLDKRKRERGEEMESEGMERCRRKKSRDVMTGSRTCSRLQFIPTVAPADQSATVYMKKPRISPCQIIR